MPKQRMETVASPESPIKPMGAAPIVFAKRELVKSKTQCLKPDIEFDALCDPEHPKTITEKDVFRATTSIRQEISATPLMKSKLCAQLGLDVHYKLENSFKTGSFHERGAVYVLQMLNEDQRRNGVFTASTGNWAQALAYRARLLKIPVTVVLPMDTRSDVILKIEDFGALVELHGINLAEAKRHAFVLMHERGNLGTYINGYDHPNAIAAAGSIGMEILDQLPQTDAILVPVGGGGLIAGIAAIVKKCKPNILIYGVESNKSCSFFKALENELPYKTYCGETIADSLAVPTAGCNAFHTAQSLIDKMILIDDDWIYRAILRLVEDEKLIAEGAAASTLGVLLARPSVLPELQNKTVVCLISGGNIDLHHMFSVTIARAQVMEGQLVKFTVKLRDTDTWQRHNVLCALADLGICISRSYTEKAWIYENEVFSVYWTLVCETKDLGHACTLKKTLQRMFPDLIDFVEEPFSPLPVCVCLHHADNDLTARLL